MSDNLPGRAVPRGDHVYEFGNWEVTYQTKDADLLFEEVYMDRSVMKVGVMKDLPDEFAARVPVGEPDEEGDYEDYEWRFFDTEAEAKAACWPKESP